MNKNDRAFFLVIALWVISMIVWVMCGAPMTEWKW